MRRFHDIHDTKQVFNVSSMSTGSPQAGLLATTSINAAGFGRARFVFSLGSAGAGASFTSGVIMAATGSGAAYSTITALPPITTGSFSLGGLLVADVPIPVNAAGTAYSWLIVSSASVINGSMAVHGIVDLYNSYIHPPASLTPTVRILIN
jgi:hypothetical protein